MTIEYWNWLESELKIPQFAIFRAYNGENLIRLDIKVKEGISERQSLEYGFNWPAFQKFVESLEDFSEKVKKSDFKNRYLQYNSGSDLIQIHFYFSKENWDLFYEFIKKVFYEFAEQRSEFERKYGRRL